MARKTPAADEGNHGNQSWWNLWKTIVVLFAVLVLAAVIAAVTFIGFIAGGGSEDAPQFGSVQYYAQGNVYVNGSSSAADEAAPAEKLSDASDDVSESSGSEKPVSEDVGPEEDSADQSDTAQQSSQSSTSKPDGDQSEGQQEAGSNVQADSPDPAATQPMERPLTPVADADAGAATAPEDDSEDEADQSASENQDDDRVVQALTDLKEEVGGVNERFDEDRQSRAEHGEQVLEALKQNRETQEQILGAVNANGEVLQQTQEAVAAGNETGQEVSGQLRERLDALHASSQKEREALDALQRSGEERAAALGRIESELVEAPREHVSVYYFESKDNAHYVIRDVLQDSVRQRGRHTVFRKDGESERRRTKARVFTSRPYNPAHLSEMVVVNGQEFDPRYVFWVEDRPAFGVQAQNDTYRYVEFTDEVEFHFSEPEDAPPSREDVRSTQQEESSGPDEASADSTQEEAQTASEEEDGSAEPTPHVLVRRFSLNGEPQSTDLVEIGGDGLIEFRSESETLQVSRWGRRVPFRGYDYWVSHPFLYGGDVDYALYRAYFTNQSGSDLVDVPAHLIFLDPNGGVWVDDPEEGLVELGDDVELDRFEEVEVK